MKKPIFSTSAPFEGFSPETLKFFRSLSRNNNRPWFAEHKDEYIRYVDDPMRRLVSELGPVIEGLDPKAITDPKRTVARIYRDTRFSGDKSPYRPRMWFAFKRNVDPWSGTPTFFFQVEEKQYLFGMGMYSASAATMRRFRELIDADPDGFLKIVTPLNRSKTVFLEDEKYTRPHPHPHPPGIDPWYQSKSVALIGRREPDQTLYSAKLVDFLTVQYLKLKPLYDFLWDATVL